MSDEEPTTTQLLAKYGVRRLELIVELEDVRRCLGDLMRTAVAEGMRQVDIVRATGYTREQIRQIVARAPSEQRVA